MKKIVLSVSLSSCLLFGVTPSDNIIQAAAGGKKIITERGTKYTPQNKENQYKDEVIFNYILVNRSVNENAYVIKNNIDTKTKNSLITEVKEEDIKNDTKPDTDIIETVSVNGYCTIRQNIKMGKQPSSAYVTCSTNAGALRVFGNLVPKNDLATLFFDPIYVEKNKKRYKVEKGSITTNEARTSYNVATYVNDRKLSEIALGSTIVSADVIQANSHAYLEALEESKKSTTVDYIDDDDNTIAVQSTTTEPPEAKDYIVKAGIDIAASIVKTTAEVFKRDLPYLYEVAKNSKIFIDLNVNKKEMKVLNNAITITDSNNTNNTKKKGK